MTLRVYVAGSSRELARVRAAQEALRAAGCVVTFDWADGLEEQRLRYPTDASLPESARHHLEERCAAGVYNSEVFWLLAPVERSIGCWVEMRDACWIRDARAREGVPYAVIGSGPNLGDTIFSVRIPAQYRFETDGDALRLILQLALLRRRAS